MKIQSLPLKESAAELMHECQVQNAGVRGDGESWLAWAVFPAWVGNETIERFCEGMGWVDYYSGPGRAFGKEPWIKESRTRRMVRWSGGLDI